jgi:hypothetical protein
LLGGSGITVLHIGHVNINNPIQGM